MKKVISVSLGSPGRDYQVTLTLPRGEVEVRRVAVSPREAPVLLRHLDGNVDAIGLGGINLYFFCGPRRYPFRQGQYLARQAGRTPVVDGSCLKEWVEPLVVPYLESRYGWEFGGRRVLFVSALDRFPLARAFAERGAALTIGDAMFALGLPFPFRSLESFTRIARLTLPLFSYWPINWLYPVGAAQEDKRGQRLAAYYGAAEVIAGDFHFIYRYLPERLSGKVVITSTLRLADVKEMRERGIRALVTFFPPVQGIFLASNVWEAILAAILGPRHFTREEVIGCLREAGWEPWVKFF